jgi:hypothetical protein
MLCGSQRLLAADGATLVYACSINALRYAGYMGFGYTLLRSQRETCTNRQGAPDNIVTLGDVVCKL